MVPISISSMSFAGVRKRVSGRPSGPASSDGSAASTAARAERWAFGISGKGTLALTTAVSWRSTVTIEHVIGCSSFT